MSCMVHAGKAQGEVQSVWCKHTDEAAAVTCLSHIRFADCARRCGPQD